MTFTIYCDESSHTLKASVEPCFVLAAVVLPSDCLPAYEEQFAARKSEHGFEGEMHWKKIGYSHGRANFVLQQFSYLRRHEDARVFAMIVHKSQYRAWSEKANREQAFYKMYAQLFKYIVRVLDADCEFVVDERSDRYARHAEALETIVGNMLAGAGASGKVLGVRRGDSVEFAGIQMADALAGSVANARNAKLTACAGHPVRGVLATRIAHALGLGTLAADTWPGSVVNIWNFPSETRGSSGKSQEVGPPGLPVWFTPDEIERMRRT